MFCFNNDCDDEACYRKNIFSVTGEKWDTTECFKQLMQGTFFHTSTHIFAMLGARVIWTEHAEYDELSGQNTPEMRVRSKSLIVHIPSVGGYHFDFKC